MLLSIIIPVYNVENYIQHCVNSILIQNSKNIEIILVDDGSPDNCPTICDEYALNNENISVIHQKNGGLSFARNSGLLKAKGDYIWFIDSDDWINEESLAIIISALKKEEVEMLGFSLIDFFEKENRYSEPYQLMSIETTNGNNYIKINGLLNPSACTYIYKTSFLKDNQLRFIEKLIHEDDYFNLECFSLVNRIRKIPYSLYFYRRRENSIFTSNVSKKRLDSFLELLKLLKSLKKSDLDLKFIDTKIYNYISLLFSLILKAKLEHKEALALVNEVKVIIPKQKIYNSDSKGIIIEKIIYNINAKFYFKLKTLRS